MSVLARLMSPRAGAMEQRTLTSSSFVPPPAVGVLDDYVGVHRAMSVMTVYACVRLLADTIASLPWKVYTRDAKGVPKEVRPQPALIQSPWPGFDLFQYKWSMVASLALRGNFYGLVTSHDPTTQMPTAIMPLHPDSVFIERRDVATKRGGWDLDQEALYPLYDEPYRRVERESGTEPLSEGDAR